MSLDESVIGATGVHAAKISTPGAVKNAAQIIRKLRSRVNLGQSEPMSRKRKKKLIFGLILTFKTFVVIGFGPREEKETTNGADKSLSSLLFIIVAVGLNGIYIYIFWSN